MPAEVFSVFLCVCVCIFCQCVILLPLPVKPPKITWWLCVQYRGVTTGWTFLPHFCQRLFLGLMQIR